MLCRTHFGLAPNLRSRQSCTLSAGQRVQQCVQTLVSSRHIAAFRCLPIQEAMSSTTAAIDRAGTKNIRVAAQPACTQQLITRHNAVAMLGSKLPHAIVFGKCELSCNFPSGQDRRKHRSSRLRRWLDLSMIAAVSAWLLTWVGGSRQSEIGLWVGQLPRGLPG